MHRGSDARPKPTHGHGWPDPWSGWLGPFRGGAQNRAGRIRTRFCAPPLNKQKRTHSAGLGMSGTRIRAIRMDPSGDSHSTTDMIWQDQPLTNAPDHVLGFSATCVKDVRTGMNGIDRLFPVQPDRRQLPANGMQVPDVDTPDRAVGNGDHPCAIRREEGRGTVEIGIRQLEDFAARSGIDQSYRTGVRIMGNRLAIRREHRRHWVSGPESGSFRPGFHIDGPQPVAIEPGGQPLAIGAELTVPTAAALLELADQSAAAGFPDFESISEVNSGRDPAAIRADSEMGRAGLGIQAGRWFRLIGAEHPGT